MIIGKRVSLALIPLLLVICANLAHGEPLSMYGVTPGMSAQEVVKNGLARGYEIYSSIALNIDGLTRVEGVTRDSMRTDARRVFVELYNEFENIRNMEVPYDKRELEFVSRNIGILSPEGRERLYIIRYSGENIPFMNIYMHRKTLDEPGTVLAMEVNRPKYDVMNALKKRYGEPSEGGTTFRQCVTWKDKDDILNSCNNAYWLFNIREVGDAFSHFDAELTRMAEQQQAEKEKEEKRKQAASDAEI